MALPSVMWPRPDLKRGAKISWQCHHCPKSMFLGAWKPSKVITEWISAHDSAKSWGIVLGLPPLDNIAMTRYPTQSHYPDNELTSPCPILEMLSARLDSDRYQFLKSLAWLD